MSLAKTNLAQHHKEIVERFHHKHREVLKKAKRNALHVASAALLTAAAAYSEAHTVQELYKQKHHQNMVREYHSLQSFLDKIPDLIKTEKELSPGEADVIAQALSQKFHLKLTPVLDGNKLNEIVGYVGQEQHLYRWAGDNLSQHEDQKHGIAPLQGAFKNFETAEQEKYYVAVQLQELPTWNKDWPTLKPWYRFRKVFVYNPANQKGVVAVIGDAGPSKFTGKTFGGSPEVMEHLNMFDGRQKSKAIILFIDDPENKIALGPANGEDIKYLAEK